MSGSPEHRRPVRPTTAIGPAAADPSARSPGADPPIRVQDAAELIAMVPALMGFHPRESLILITTGGPSGRRIGLTLRADLPPPAPRGPLVADAVGSVLLDDPAGVAVIILAAPGGGSHPPYAELAYDLVDALAEVDVEAHTVVWAASTAAGAPWACYGTCGCSGRLPDPASTVYAAAVVADGQVIHADRADMERVVAPADPERIRRRERMLIARHDAAVQRSAPVAGMTDGLAAVDAAIAAVAAGELDLDDDTAAELAEALGDPRVRDAALLRNVEPSAAAAEQLWAVLCRELPDPEAAEPAALLAASALLRGHGALANVALDRAEQAWPGHRLTRLLRQVAVAGVRPGEFRTWLTGGRGLDHPERRC